MLSNLMEMEHIQEYSKINIEVKLLGYCDGC